MERIHKRFTWRADLFPGIGYPSCLLPTADFTTHFEGCNRRPIISWKRNQVGKLKDESDFFAVKCLELFWAAIVDAVATEDEFSACRRGHKPQDYQERRLSLSTRPHGCEQPRQ